MRVLVTGVNGQLGHDVMLELSQRGHDCIGSGSSDEYHGVHDFVSSLPYVKLDICSSSEVTECLNEFLPDAVIHCAAWTNVEAAEDVINREAVYAINVQGTENLAEACSKIGAKLLYISSDYVFASISDAPHKADDTDFGPLNEYGKSKLEGELAVKRHLSRYFIVRTSWLFGKNGSNFVKTIIKAGRKNGKVYVVNDQIGTPTYSLHLSRLLVDMIESDKYGVYHGTNEGGYISWYDFTKEIFKIAKVDAEVHPVSTEAYSCTTRRPFNSRLDKSKLVEMGFRPLPDWREALDDFIKI